MSDSIAEDILMHYGTKFHSGRYPYGSGKESYQHSGDFLSRVDELKKQNLDYTDEDGKHWSGEAAIANALGMTTTDFRMQTRVANHERRRNEADRARSLRDDGKSLAEIALIMGYKNDSSIRSLLDENTAGHKEVGRTTADTIKKVVDQKDIVDIGAGVERELGVSANTLKEASFILRTEGYNVYGIGVPNATNPKVQTTLTVLAKPGISYKDAYALRDAGKIESLGDYTSKDSGSTFTRLKYPQSIDSKRVHINYGDEGGKDKDGVIEIRPGVKDLDLGNSHYAQVRILVDGTHYLKGMAMYGDPKDFPDGSDIMFNTNKLSGTPKEKVLKKIYEEDPSNPFKAAIKANGQSYYDDPNGKYIDPVTGKKQSLSAINKLKEEGDWDHMSKNLSAQFLSKQPLQLINKQLDLTYADRVADYEEILSLTNPAIKKNRLLDFANNCDSAVVHLKAAALPRQCTQVILPLTHLKETEIYAPNFKNGETVSLVRYPHAGTFEIPQLKVNNNDPSGKKILGNVMDAVGINPKVAERLSGADFDGDQVIVIPTNSNVRIKSTRALDDLKDFDPKVAYSTEGKTGIRLMSEKEKQKQMGTISNLITDMTLAGADDSEIARAVKHSMVVIDAPKHSLDYTRSEKENGISELQKKYQGYIDDEGKHVGGASTLISRHKSEIRVPERRGSAQIDPETGKISYKESGRTYIDEKTGKEVMATTSVRLLNHVDDVRKISSGTAQEDAYADYANRMKALANQARKEYKSTGNMKYNPEANKEYAAEVSRLNSALNEAAKNAPRERKAQVLANSKVKAMIQEHPEMVNNKDDIKKARNRAIVEARTIVGADGKGTRIKISDREWEAIQKGAISETNLNNILRYADADKVRELATPRDRPTVSTAKESKIKAMKASGYTNAQIAEQLGLSTSTINKYATA